MFRTAVTLATLPVRIPLAAFRIVRQARRCLRGEHDPVEREHHWTLGVSGPSRRGGWESTTVITTTECALCGHIIEVHPL